MKLSAAVFRQLSTVALGISTFAPVAQADRGARIAVAGNGDRSGSDQAERDNQKRAKSEPPPAKVTEHQRGAGRDAEAARATDQREESNLKAQVRIADAAERQEGIAWWQALFSGLGIAVTSLGTAYLVLTFRETKRTAAAAMAAAVHAARQADAADRSLSLAQSTAQLQLRPVVSHDFAELVGTDRDHVLRVQVRNHGATAAHDLRINIVAHVVRWPPASRPPFPPSDHWMTPNMLPPGHSAVAELMLPELSGQEREGIYRQRLGLLVTVRAKYVGGDGDSYETIVDLVAIGLSSVEGRVAIYDPAMI